MLSVITIRIVGSSGGCEFDFDVGLLLPLTAVGLRDESLHWQFHGSVKCQTATLRFRASVDKMAALLLVTCGGAVKAAVSVVT